MELLAILEREGKHQWSSTGQTLMVGFVDEVLSSWPEPVSAESASMRLPLEERELYNIFLEYSTRIENAGRVEDLLHLGHQGEFGFGSAQRKVWPFDATDPVFG